MVLKVNYIFRYLFYRKLNKSYAYAYSIHMSTQRMTLKSLNSVYVHYLLVNKTVFYRYLI